MPFLRIISIKTPSEEHIGFVDGDEVIDLNAVDNRVPHNLADWLKAKDGDLSGLRELAVRAPASARQALSQIQFGLPVARPNKVLCLGLNYMQHVKEGRYADEIPKHPTVFLRCLTSLAPHNSELLRPDVSETFDYEAELALVIGRRCKNLKPEHALACIAGYTCANEGTIREFQRRTTQWDMGKNFDRTGAIGPWLVSADELPSGAQGLKIECRLNGKKMQSDTTDNMLFPVRELLVYITQGITLEPGDIILTGTPSGVGHARKPPVWMRDSDVCEVYVEAIGTLQNSIANERPTSH